MRAVVQRVTRARVVVAGSTTGEITDGLVVLLGVTHQDREVDALWLAGKVVGLRVFSDRAGRMNFDVRDVTGGVLVVPQFTLYADAAQGRRPDFIEAAKPEVAAPLFRRFCAALEEKGVPVSRGVFQAHMELELVNDGPVTILLETPTQGSNR
jgi:D-tyrosyl-tRNA(Tyr) deacylase